MLKSFMENNKNIWFNTITHNVTYRAEKGLIPSVEKDFEEIAGTKRKYHMDLRKNKYGRFIYTHVTSPLSPNENVSIYIDEDTQERLPYRFSFEGTHKSGYSTADYDETHKLRVLGIGINAPNSYNGSLEYLPTHLPVIEFEFYNKIIFNIWNNIFLEEKLVTKVIPDLTPDLREIESSPLVFRHGEVKISASLESGFIQVCLNRPDNIKIVSVVPVSIPQLNFERLLDGNCNEWLKLPTNDFSTKYFDGDSEIKVGVNN